eukprot:scaffold91879_cov63-Phaeocystis_antarctica.AAC.1
MGEGGRSGPSGGSGAVLGAGTRTVQALAPPHAEQVGRGGWLLLVAGANRRRVRPNPLSSLRIPGPHYPRAPQGTFGLLDRQARPALHHQPHHRHWHREQRQATPSHRRLPNRNRHALIPRGHGPVGNSVLKVLQRVGSVLEG